MDEVDPKQVVTNWLRKIQQPRKELGGHRICPYASMPLIKEVDKLTEDCFDVMHPRVIAYVEKTVTSTFNELNDLCSILNKKYPTHIFLPDHPHRKNYIKGIETGNEQLPIILAQTKEELTTFRKVLQETNYYDNWDKEYLEEIMSYGQ